MSFEDVNSLLGRELEELGQALGGGIPKKSMTVQKSMGYPPTNSHHGYRTHWVPGPSLQGSPISHTPPGHAHLCARAHTHTQPASCSLKRPGLTRREGTSRVGGPGRIQLHLFTPIGHGLVAAGW